LVLQFCFKILNDSLESGRRKLLGHFYKAEAGLETDETAFEGIDDLFIKLFTKAKDESGNIILWSLNDFLRPSKGRKWV
jgi:hypothetical protein